MKGATQLELGRKSYREQAWVRAFDSLASADREVPLGAKDLEMLARSAYMLGRDDDYVAGLERAHEGYLERGDVPSAVRCGFWIGHSFLFRGERTGNRLVRPRRPVLKVSAVTASSEGTADSRLARADGYQQRGWPPRRCKPPKSANSSGIRSGVAREDDQARLIGSGGEGRPEAGG